MTDRSASHNPSRPNPVRPAALDAADAPAAHEDTIPLLEPDAPTVRPVAASPRPAEVDDHASPCDGCGYDLRGRPGGGVCPECGRPIPRWVGGAGGAGGGGGGEGESFGASIADAFRGSPGAAGGALGVRETASGGWRGFAVASLAPIGLLTPIPLKLSLGVPIAVALGFAPVFRLNTLARVRTLPDSILGPFRIELARMRAIQITELVFVGGIVLYGAVGTFGSIPAMLLPLYRAIILAWWFVAIEGLVLQMRFGHALARTLVDPAVLPPIGRPVAAARTAQLLLLAGAGLGATAAFGMPPASMLANASLVVSFLLLAAAAISGGSACVVAYGHAGMVAECIFEAPALRPPRRTNNRPGGRDAASGGATVRRASDDDDDPLPLA